MVRLVAVLLAVLTPQVATAAPAARLVTCQDATCLLVTGQRDDATSAVRINGHPVAVEGHRRWRVSLPVETVRRWSAPFARTIAVATSGPHMRDEVVAEADLPIGLLGLSTDLAMLTVRVR